MNTKLMKIKSILIGVLNSRDYDQCDYEQLEYLIQVIDWILLKELPMDEEILLGLMEDMVISSVHLLNLDILEAVKTLNKIKKELYAEV